MRLLSMLLGFGILGVLELGLRLSGVAAFGVPAEDLLAPRETVFERSGDLLETRASRTRSFLLQRFAADKPPGVRRVFVTGGSTALGFPLQGVHGPTELLQTGLDAAHPGRRHEVINAGAFAYAAYRLVAVVEEVLEYSPELIVVMTGHNEFLERRYPVETDWWPTRLHLYRGLQALWALARGEAEAGRVHWSPHEVGASERGRVAEGYRASLREIAALCRAANVPLALVSLPSNLQFAPRGRSRVAREELLRVHERIAAGALDEAEALLAPLESEQPRDAWVRYTRGRLAQAALPEGQEPLRSPPGSCEPEDALCQARDLDRLPIRGPSALERVLADVAREEGAILCQPGRLPALSSPSSEELFFDHCHPKPPGQRVIMMELLERLADAWETPPAGWRPRVHEAWERLRRAVPDEKLAEGYLQIGIETGINLDRPHRGLALVRHAMALDPRRGRGGKLVAELERRAGARPRLLGE